MGIRKHQTKSANKTAPDKLTSRKDFPITHLLTSKKFLSNRALILHLPLKAVNLL